MKKRVLPAVVFGFCLIVCSHVFAESIDVLIKGMDNGIKTSRDRDYAEAVMNAKFQAIERAGGHFNP